ncbi:MAG: ATP-binding protein [Clostridiales bacterium]|jgi:DNA replication protein DnaC|nr:ATP-binding protein [Clostridiales bacterium]
MQNYKDIIKHTIATRKQQLLSARQIYDNLLENQEFYQNECALRKAILSDDKKGIELSLKKKEQFAKKLGVDMETLHPTPHCNLCKDTGFVNSEYCKCIIKKASDKFLSKHMYLSGLTFENIDVSFYQDNKETLLALIKNLKIFCKRKPLLNPICMVFCGNTGTGKTHLAGCVSNMLMENGHSVIFVSAMQFVRSMTKYHTTFDDTKEQHYAPYMDTDMLIIDDLGTESMFNNITIEYLYQIVSQRLSNNKHMLITTNLNREQLTDRYGMRIVSRLYDKKRCIECDFTGQDMRII